jgi:predicted AAA+ superfamily ATPase
MSIFNILRLESLSAVSLAASLPIRRLVAKIDWGDRLIGILGPKGVGKSTALLQQYAVLADEGLYLSLDSPSSFEHPLLELARQFYTNGGRVLFLDEVHKYPGWSLAIKNIYDQVPKLKVVFSGSSALHIHASDGDLSRRASIYQLPVFSLREFIALETGMDLPTISIGALAKTGNSFADQIVQKIQPVPHLKRYFENGAYPFYLEGVSRFHAKLRSIVNYTIEADLVQLFDLDPRYVPKLRKLLQMISVSVPFTPNISSLAQALEISRASVLRYLELLERGGIIALAHAPGRGYQKLSKPEKVYFDNPNLVWAFASGRHEIGQLRETFVISQLRSAGIKVEIPLKGDFLVDGQLFIEIGGANKGEKQIHGQSNSIVLSDDIEVGAGRIVPLWVVGFLY